VSLFFLLGVFDLWNGLWILLVGAVGTYTIAFGIKGPMMPWIAFIFVMGQMSISHLIRQIYKTPDSVVDYTGYRLHDQDAILAIICAALLIFRAQMVLCQKLTAFAWNVYDGRQNIDVPFLVVRT
jgi:lysophospholipid acyltransferase